MSTPLHTPTLHVAANDLWVAGNDIEGCLCLGSVELRYEVEKSLAQANALVIRQNHEPMHTIIPAAHVNTHNRDESHWLILVNGNVALRLFRY
jgi:hypothetical protein